MLLLSFVYNINMNFLENLKNKFGMHLISICGYVLLYFIFIWPYLMCEGVFIGLLWMIPIIYIALFYSFIIYIIELIANHKIKNKFILKNPIYNFFFIIGLLLVIALTLMLAYIYFFG